MKEIKFDDALEEIKKRGKSERETVELASELSRVIGELTDARIGRGLTQRQLAEKCGIKQSAIARMESLQTIPRLDTMIKVARCLDVEVHIGPQIEDTSVCIVTINPQYSWNINSFDEIKPAFTGKEYAYEAIG